MEKKRTDMRKRDEKYPDDAATTRAASTIQKQILAAARKSAAAETEIADVLHEFTGNPSTPREEKDFQEIKALLRSLDGPEYLLRSQGYSRAIFPPDQSTIVDPFE